MVEDDDDVVLLFDNAVGTTTDGTAATLILDLSWLMLFRAAKFGGTVVVSFLTPALVTVTGKSAGTSLISVPVSIALNV